MTANQRKKQLFQTFLSDASFRMWLSSSDLLFILLQKKQCKLIKHLLGSVPCLIHRLDKEGNDALLYVCLTVRGCRHRLVEYLIKMGCDLQRKNSKGEHFIQTLQLARNRELFKKLIEHEIIRIDNNSGEV
jgi:ankyrin repeat protein